LYFGSCNVSLGLEVHNNVGLDQGVQVPQGALSLCPLSPPYESLGVQARFGKFVIEARVRSLSYKLGLEACNFW